jgi:hypothetical protein
MVSPLTASYFLLHAQEISNQREGPPNDLSCGYPRHCFISSGPRIRTPVLMRFRYIHVAQPKNKTMTRQAIRGK